MIFGKHYINIKQITTMNREYELYVGMNKILVAKHKHRKDYKY